MQELGIGPVVTIVLNLVAGALVSKGILDANSRDVFIQLANNIIAGLITITLGVYSIYKMVDLKKHQVTHGPATHSVSTSIPESVSQASTQTTTPVTQEPPTGV